jgi:hypothetical protein
LLVSLGEAGAGREYLPDITIRHGAGPVPIWIDDRDPEIDNGGPDLETDGRQADGHGPHCGTGVTFCRILRSRRYSSSALAGELKQQT